MDVKFICGEKQMISYKRCSYVEKANHEKLPSCNFYIKCIAVKWFIIPYFKCFFDYNKIIVRVK